MLAPPLLKLLITHLAAAPQFVLVGRVELTVEFAKLAVQSNSGRGKTWGTPYGVPHGGPMGYYMGYLHFL